MSETGATKALPFSLSFVDGLGRLALREVATPSVQIERLELDIKGLTFPFDLTNGPERLRDRWLEARALDFTFGIDLVRDTLAREVDGSRQSLAELDVELANDSLELVGRIGTAGHAGPWFVLRYVPDVVREQDLVLRPALFTLLGRPLLSFPQVAAAISSLELPFVEAAGMDLHTTDVPRAVLKQLLPPAGYRIPDCRKLHLHSVDMDRKAGITLRYRVGSFTPTTPSALAMAIGEVSHILAPGDAAVVEGDLDEARRRYVKAQSQEPGHGVITERIAWLDAASPTRAEAARVWCERGLDDQDAPGLHAVLGSLLLAEDAVGEAASHFEHLQEHLGPLGRSRVLLLLGRLKLQRKDAAAAAALLESALTLDPNLVDAMEALRDCYVTLGQPEQLQATAARLAAVDDRPEVRSHVLTDLGRLWHHRFGDVYRATDCYEEALLCQPDAHDALLGLADCHAAKGEYQAGLRCLDAVVKVAADCDDRDLEIAAHLQAGELWEEIGDPKSAATRYHRAAKLDPGSAPAVESSARIDEALGRHEMAAAGYGQLITIARDGNDRPLWRRALHKLARLQLDLLGAPGPALAAVELFLQSHPDDEQGRELLAEVRGPEAKGAKGAKGAKEPELAIFDDLINDEELAEEPAGEPEPAPEPVVAESLEDLGRPDLWKLPPPLPPLHPPPPAPPPSPEPAPDLYSAIAQAAGSGPGLSDLDEDIDALLQSHLQSPDDEELAERVIDRLETEQDWARLAAVLAGLAEHFGSTAPDKPAAAANRPRQIALLCHLADVLIDGLEDPESGAECLLRVAELTPAGQGVSHARRAEALFRQEGLDTEAEAAEKLADELARK